MPPVSAQKDIGAARYGDFTPRCAAVPKVQFLEIRIFKPHYHEL